MGSFLVTKRKFTRITTKQRVYRTENALSKNAPCPHSSVFECEIVRENSKKLESVLSFLIEQKY